MYNRTFLFESGDCTLQQISVYQIIITFNFSLDRKVTKDQADMNAARSVRPLTAAANVNKNAGQSKKETNSDGFAFL